MIVAALLCLSLSQGAPDAYRWPLDLPRQLTSSFAEFRPGRFHAGIDLRTGGIGIPVYAAAEGHVSRVRCSPWGYGKAVYLQFRDGNSAIYAHLDDYTDAVRTFVRAAQHAAKSYTVDLYPEPGQFPVARGDLIGRAGRTGTGAAHLHYELRDTAGNPINPRLLGVTWPDETAPTPSRLLLMPLDNQSRVDGDLVPRIYPLVHLGDGRYTTPTVRARGRIAVGIDLVDESAGARLGVRELRLCAGDEELFRLRHDTLSYENHRDARVSYHPYFLADGRFLLLWRWPGNDTSSYGISNTDGTLDVEALTQGAEVRVEAIDFAGNLARVLLPLSAPIPDDERPGASALPGADAAASPGAPGGSGEVSFDVLGPALTVTARFSEREPDIPELVAEGGGRQAVVSFQRVGPELFRALFTPEHSSLYRIRVNHPRVPPMTHEIGALVRGDTASLPLGNVTLKATEETAYGTLFVMATRQQEEGHADLRVVGDAWELWPVGAPVDAPLTIELPWPEGAHERKVALYQKQAGWWSRIGGAVRAGRFEAPLSELGVYALMEDTAPPRVVIESPPENYHAETRRPKIRASVSDAGSGVESVAIECSGKWLLSAYDGPRETLRWERDEDLPRGPQEITVTAVDASGNKAVARRQVVVP